LRKASFAVAVLASAAFGPCCASEQSEVFPAAPQRDLVVRACAACHPPELVVAKHRSAEEWDAIIARMVDHGAVANETEQQQILEYLVKFLGQS
jgi:hypothetical protein